MFTGSKKPRTVGEELITPAVVYMTEILCGQKEAKRLCSVSLSARDVKERLSSFTEHFAIQLEETIVVSSNSQLMPCVRYSGSDVTEEIFPVLHMSSELDELMSSTRRICG